MMPFNLMLQLSYLVDCTIDNIITKTEIKN